jgi:hypothetical protein
VSAEADAAKDEDADEAERQANSVKDQLSKEAASWSKKRREQASGTVVGPSPPVIQPPSARPARESKKSSPPSDIAKGSSASSKPFGMSYDGMTQAKYIQYLRDRGSR